jgi:nucleoside-diphosphate-sugar epimerase
MKLFVTGASGFLGGWLMPHLKAHEVIAPSHAELDVTDEKATEAAIAHAKPDVVVHLAALCGAIPSQQNPRDFFRVNAQGTVSVLEACRRAAVGKLLFTSSMTVFGAGESAQQIDSPFAPRHPYASAKIGAEFAVRSYCRNYNISAAILRPTLVVGERYKEPHAIGDFVETVRAGRAIDIFGAGTHVRDFVHPDDVARAMAACVGWLAVAPPGAVEALNFSNDEPIAIAALADLVIATTGRGEKRFVQPTAQSFSLFADNRRIAELLSVRAQISNREIIERLWRQS